MGRGRRERRGRNWPLLALCLLLAAGVASMIVTFMASGSRPVVSSPPVSVYPVTHPPAYPPIKKAPAVSHVRRYVVQAGDCLWTIAQRHLGSGSRWPVLWELNRKAIGPRPWLIYPGMILKL